MEPNRYTYPNDAAGQPIREPLLWYMPPPCVTAGMTVNEAVAFGELVKHIIAARLAAEDTPHQIDNLSISEMVSPCRGKTAHVYELWFKVQRTEVNKMREDLQAAVPLGVKKVVVGSVISPLPSSVPRGRSGRPHCPSRLMTATYYVHCLHNKRYAGNAKRREEKDYVQVKPQNLW